ncbi:MAG: alanine racemase, partial [Planctomycetota bacterium]|nr:alanine racemase [Planctomycetota bacterium]
MNNPRTWAEVDLGAMGRNLQKVRKALTRGTRVLAVVKANAYGHGAVAVSRTLLENGASVLGVGDSGEAIELRESGISAPIIILGAICEREVEPLVEYRIIPSIHSLDRAEALQDAMKRYGASLGVNVMTDTGMGRLGIKPENALELLEFVRSCPNLYLVGLSTHFSSAHSNKEFTLHQLKLFRGVLEKAKSRGIHIPLIHTANSAALFSLPETHFSMVRPGAALYGIDPGNLKEYGIELEPVLSWYTQVVFLKGVEEGTPIGYNRSFIAPRRMKIATLCVGYNDGFHFAFSNRGEVLIRGHRCRVVGNVTMDYIMVDVTEVPDVAVG